MQNYLIPEKNWMIEWPDTDKSDSNKMGIIWYKKDIDAIWLRRYVITENNCPFNATPG